MCAKDDCLDILFVCVCGETTVLCVTKKPNVLLKKQTEDHLCLLNLSRTAPIFTRQQLIGPHHGVETKSAEEALMCAPICFLNHGSPAPGHSPSALSLPFSTHHTPTSI